MRKQAFSSHVLLFFSLIFMSLAAFFVGRIASAQATNQGEVKSDTLAVYSEMSTTSSVVKTLTKGARVNIRLQVTGAEGAWCKIAELGQTNSLGYVLCSQLFRATEPHASKPTSQGASVPVISSSAGSQILATPRTGSFITSFERETIRPARRDPNITYDLDPSRERFFVHISAAYSGQSRYGLVVFVDAGDRVNVMPDGWPSVLDARNFLFIAPENAGNDQYRERRLGLGVLSALEMMKHYQIDANRVYISGFSGGARMAGLLGFFQSDVFQGTIQNCGADFYEHVPQVYSTSQLDTAGRPYGFFPATADEVHGAKRVRFVLITGSEDFRRGNILDVFNGGFVKAGFQAKLFDVPGMSHDTADARTLNAALDFLEALH
jgi:hypothetical protein